MLEHTVNRGDERKTFWRGGLHRLPFKYPVSEARLGPLPRGPVPVIMRRWPAAVTEPLPRGVAGAEVGNLHPPPAKTVARPMVVGWVAGRGDLVSALPSTADLFAELLDQLRVQDVPSRYP